MDLIFTFANVNILNLFCCIRSLTYIRIIMKAHNVCVQLLTTVELYEVMGLGHPHNLKLFGLHSLKQSISPHRFPL